MNQRVSIEPYLPKARVKRKTNRGIGIIFFLADDYTVVMET